MSGKKRRDLTGQRFGKLLALSFIGKDKFNRGLYLTMCDCGTIKVIVGYDLYNSSKTNCGCIRRNFVDLTGQVFGRLTVLGFSHYDKYSIHYWKVRCSCGTEKVVGGSSMVGGSVKSCGCLRREVTSKRSKGRFVSDETRAKISKNHADFSGPKNPRFGTHFSEESRKKLSDSHIGLMKGKDHPNYGKPSSIYSGRGIKSWFTKRDGRKIRLRSTYEARMVDILESFNIEWEYENRIYLDDIIWHPDFYLPNKDLFIEVKGWLTEDAKQKLILFNKLYPGKNLLIIELKDIILLENGAELNQVGTPLNIYLQQLVQ